MQLRSRQLGDTIVEVMIAMAIIGLVIAVSYSTASRALQVGRRAQERTEALKEAEGQIESLKSLASSSDPAQDIFSTTTGGPTDPAFCISGTAIYTNNTIFDDLFATGVNLNTAPANTTPTGTNTYNAQCVGGTSNRYKKSITRVDSNSGTGSGNRSTFTVRVRWERIGGGIDEVKLVYNLNKGQFSR